MPQSSRSQKGLSMKISSYPNTPPAWTQHAKVAVSAFWLHVESLLIRLLGL